MPPIVPRFAGFMETALILMLGPRVPRFWMKFSRCFQFFFPFAQQRRWHSIGKSEGDEVGSARLAPMGQIARCNLYFAVPIQTTEAARFNGRDARWSHRRDACATETAVFLNNLLNIAQKPPVDFRQPKN